MIRDTASGGKRPTANYHTHTVRCRHAEGTEREYIENAISAGITTMGFSDHAPYVFQGDYYSNFRMRPEELSDYVETLLELRREYQDKIDIRIGLEAEYYPAHFEQFLRLLEPYPIDYLILGQHFLKNEYDGEYSGMQSDSEEKLACYVEQVIAGISTGKFSYIAHPDLFHFVGETDVYNRYMKKLCQEAKKMQIPLEVNYLGFWDGRNYPSQRFFRIAAEVGNEVIFGFDAHSPDLIHSKESFEGCLHFIKKMGLRRTEKISMR